MSWPESDTDKMMRKSFGRVFARLRNQARLTQGEVARRRKVSRTCVSYLERGISGSISCGNLVVYADILGIDPLVLFSLVLDAYREDLASSVTTDVVS